MKRIAVIMLAAAAVAGCAGIREGVKGLAGISTRQVEDTLGTASRESFDAEWRWLYAHSETVLREGGSYVYSKDPAKKLIAIYVSEIDTTPVGIFFEEQPSGGTLVAVSSPSVSARERVAQGLFSGLNDLLKAKKVDVQLDAIEGR